MWADIHKTPTADLLDAAGLRRGSADVLIGGPPCQPFSKSGYWANGDSKRLNDPRALTLDAYMRVVEETLPQVLLLENVAGISFSGKEEGLLHLIRLFEGINRRNGTSYVPTWRVLDAADYGVPQRRSRFFMVADRDGRSFRFPDPSHGTSAQPHVTAWAAIGHLRPDPSEQLAVLGRWGPLLPSVPEGENYLWHTARKGGLPLFGWRRRYWSFLLKLAKNRPSWTIQAEPGPAIGPFHWESRRLSVREMAALQTFPADVVFVGGRNAVQRQIGNAVPSLLAEILAREIRFQLLDGTVPDAPTLRVDEVSPPPPEPVEPVPEAFLALIGDHSPHPGTGKGHAAMRAGVSAD
jgi:DNA (cytosine-5)-methyltransferase 1